jgi:hypothetical protein
VKLGEKSRSLNELKQFINGMLKTDPYIGHLFKRDKDTKNDKIKAIQTEFESELLKLMEIVLLDKTGPVS